MLRLITGKKSSKARRSSSAAADNNNTNNNEEDGAIGANEAEIGDDTPTEENLTLPPADDAKAKKQVLACIKSMKKSPSSVGKQRKNLAKLRLYCNASPAKSARTIHYLFENEGNLLVERAMTTHKKTVTIQNHGCRIVALLARDNALATISALPCILEAMKSHKRNSNLQCNALSTLSFWGMAKEQSTTSSTNQEGQEVEGPSLAIRIVEQGAYAVIFSTMLSTWYETHSLVQEKALKTLVILVSAAKECRNDFVSAKAWKVLNGAFKNFATKPKMVLKALKILRYVSQDHPAPVAKRLFWVLHAMKAHITDASLQRAGCAVLLQLAANHPASHEELVKSGGGRDAILAAMQNHESNEEIQKTAILALQKLPDPNRQRQPEQHPDNNNNPQTPPQPPTTDTFDAVTQGLKVMINTLLKETTTAQSSTNICKALIKLAVESHTNKLDIANANGVPAILSVMKRHPTHTSLQRYGCQALGQLAQVEATKRAIVHDHQGVPVLSSALVDHASATHLVALHGILVLVRLAQVLDNHKALLEAPIVPTLVQAMKNHLDHKQIQHKSMIVLHKLCTRYTRAKLPMIQSGSLKAVLRALKQHSSDLPLAKMACQCILHLHHRTTSAAIVKAGCLQAVTACMTRHGDRIGMQLVGIRTITEITQYTAHLHYWAGDHVGGLRCLVVALETHPDHAVFHELAIGLIMKSSSRALLRPLVVQAGGIPVVLKGMKIHHPAHPFVQQMGFKTLYNLTTHSWHHGAIIFRKGGWRVVRHAQVVCPDDPILQKHAWTLMAQLLLMFLVHWGIWAFFHVVNFVGV